MGGAALIRSCVGFGVKPKQKIKKARSGAPPHPRGAAGVGKNKN